MWHLGNAISQNKMIASKEGENLDMRYKADYVGYELGNFLPPDYRGHENCDVFFLLLQNPSPDTKAETFSVRLGKTRYLDDPFSSDCLKVF